MLLSERTSDFPGEDRFSFAGISSLTVDMGRRVMGKVVHFKTAYARQSPNKKEFSAFSLSFCPQTPSLSHDHHLAGR